MERHRKPRQLLFQLLQWQVSKAKPGSVTASDPPRISKLALSKQHRGHDKITHKIINDCIYFLCLPQIILWRSETKARQCSVGVSLLRLIPQLQHRTHQLGNSWAEEENNTAGFPFLALTPGSSGDWHGPAWMCHLLRQHFVGQHLPEVLHQEEFTLECLCFYVGIGYELLITALQFTLQPKIPLYSKFSQNIHFKMLWHLLFWRNGICFLSLIALSSCEK